MSLFNLKQHLQAQIIEVEKFYNMVRSHPIMAKSLEIKLQALKEELASLPTEFFEPVIRLLFSGNAVIGSQGIKSSFVSKTLPPLQEMIKTQFALHRFGQVSERGKTKNGSEADLYLSALPAGSFGVELTQLKASDLYSRLDVSKSMKEVIALVQDSSIGDDSFEKAIEETPKRNLSNLKKFLQEISEEKSILKMECGELFVELPENKVLEAYQRVSATIDEVEDWFIQGIFKGFLLDSGRFEILDEDGKRISGFINEELSEKLLVDYNRLFLNNSCQIHLNVHRTTFKTGAVKVDYELLEIKPK